MVEYGSEQKHQESRAVACNGGNSQLKKIVDNRFSINGLQLMIQLCKWKTGSIEKKIKAEQDASPDKSLTVTAHHTVPKKKLVKAYETLSFIEQKAIGKDLLGVDAVLTPKQIQSLPFNLTLGPLPGQRSDDPRDEFDPNYSGGILTPRSQALEEMFDTTGEIDPTKIRASLKKASDAHKSNPILDRSTWVKEPSGDFHRDW